MKTLKLALDWTPNINHLGFFVAQELGFYQELDLNLEISDPAQDGYTITPAKKVELGEADFALCPTESLISYRTKSQSFPMVALAAILQEDLSAIAVKEDSGIVRPRELNGCHYASYQARYEDGIVKAMIKNDGGAGELEISYPKKLGIWNTLLEGKADATWVFLNWEGVEARQNKLSLRYFKMADYGIPYSYSPVITADENRARENKTAYRNFLAATKKGFLHSLDHPTESLDILRLKLPAQDRKIDLAQCLNLSAAAFGSEVTWGKLEPENLRRFLGWLQEQGLETNPPSAEELIYQF